MPAVAVCTVPLEPTGMRRRTECGPSSLARAKSAEWMLLFALSGLEFKRLQHPTHDQATSRTLRTSN